MWYSIRLIMCLSALIWSTCDSIADETGQQTKNERVQRTQQRKLGPASWLIDRGFRIIHNQPLLEHPEAKNLPEGASNRLDASAGQPVESPEDNIPAPVEPLPDGRIQTERRAPTLPDFSRYASPAYPAQADLSRPSLPTTQSDRLLPAVAPNSTGDSSLPAAQSEHIWKSDLPSTPGNSLDYKSSQNVAPQIPAGQSRYGTDYPYRYRYSDSSYRPRSSSTYVHSYTRKDGTYVSGHYRHSRR